MSEWKEFVSQVIINNKFSIDYVLEIVDFNHQIIMQEAFANIKDPKNNQTVQIS